MNLRCTARNQSVSYTHLDVYKRQDDYPEPESIALAMKLGLPVMEAPVKMNERQGGRSSIGGFSSVYYMIKVTLAIVLVCWVHRGDK